MSGELLCYAILKKMLDKVLLEVLAQRRYKSEHGPPVSIEIVKEKKVKIEPNYASVLLETYSRIGLVRSYGNLQSYWTTKYLWKLTVVLDYWEGMETYSRIGLYDLVNPVKPSLLMRKKFARIIQQVH